MSLALGSSIRSLLITAVICAILFPLYIALDTSLKPRDQIRQFPRSFLTLQPILTNYREALTTRKLPQHMQITVVIGACTVLLGIGLGAPAALALSRFRFRGQHFFSRIILMVYMFPPMLLVVPLYLLFAQLKMNDSLWSLVLTYTTFSLPFSIWMLKAFFDTVPRELDEAALIDGCTPIGAMFRIILPLSGPGVAATAIFCFMLAWGEYLFALTFITSQNLFPITVAIYSLIGPFVLSPGLLMAAALLSAFVPLILFFAAQKWIVKGLTAGAVRG